MTILTQYENPPPDPCAGSHSSPEADIPIFQKNQAGLRHVPGSMTSQFWMF
jgi:hypothetical protein